MHALLCQGDDDGIGGKDAQNHTGEKVNDDADDQGCTHTGWQSGREDLSAPLWLSRAVGLADHRRRGLCKGVAEILYVDFDIAR